MRKKITIAAVAAVTGAMGMLSSPAHATLGEAESTVQGDSQRQNGSIKSVERAIYRVHEIQLPSGTVLREYAVAGGQVFAVVWQGPSIPDLRQTLGQYFDAYVGGQVKGASRNHLSVEHTDFVAHAGGHMRAFNGLAYLPRAVPAGVSLGELR